ncbi:hypothetical protein Scep_021870 [Stephania cephalantha]|uniref:Uncharacterized protein n=1 Tax=Stephania cephalantha TaxID=152367 RepID=A0AAP0F5C8_9MAGN
MNLSFEFNCKNGQNGHLFIEFFTLHDVLNLIKRVRASLVKVSVKLIHDFLDFAF